MFAFAGTPSMMATREPRSSTAPRPAGLFQSLRWSLVLEPLALVV
jgi:hypothetical protein